MPLRDDLDIMARTVEGGQAILAASGIQIGQRYRHYKKGTIYKIVKLSLDEGDLEPLVHYEDPGGITWTRTLKAFQGRVALESQLVPRFALI